RMQKSHCCTLTLAILDCMCVVTNTLLLLPVEILNPPQAHFFTGLDNGFTDRIAELSGTDMQGAASATQIIRTQLVILYGTESLFHCWPAPVVTSQLPPTGV